jgi:hypothetical protein
MNDRTPNAATKVFHIPELLELILLAIPKDNIYQEIVATRCIYISRTSSRTWHDLIGSSSPLRQMLYLPTDQVVPQTSVYDEVTSFPPAQPNPWIPYLLLNQRSWGSAYPFDNAYTAYNLRPSEPKKWTFSFEVSRAQFERFPEAGAWRDMLVSSPPFFGFWYTRSFYEVSPDTSLSI